MKFEESLIRELIYRDVYRMMGKFRAFDTIIDIGANIGMFCLQARMFNPEATIHAFEPAPSFFKALQEFTHMGVHLHNIGIGDGNPARFKEDGVRSQVTEKGKYVIQTAPLDQIWNIAQPTGWIMLKCDCEGGEIYLRGNEEYLRKCKQASIEVHSWGKLPSMKDWEQWFRQFEDQFDVFVEPKMGFEEEKKCNWQVVNMVSRS